jgi:hypothetical protein
MLWLTEDARLRCDHYGAISVTPTQGLVRIEKRRVLVQSDPEGCSIAACTNGNPLLGVPPCLHTLDVRDGYSAFVRIQGDPVCLSSLLGYTDGAPPRVASYRVADPAQIFVEAAS